MIKIAYKPDKAVWVSMALVAALAAAYSFLSPQTYKATCQISVDSGNIASNAAENPDFWQAYINDQAMTMKNDELIGQVVEKLHLRLARQFANTDPVPFIKRSIDVTHPKDSNLINISVRMDNPDFAARIAQSLTESYIARKEDKKFVLAKDAIAWFKEANEASKNVLAAQEALNKFVKDNSLESFKEDLEAAQEAITRLGAERAQEESMMKNVADKLNELDAAIKSGNRENVFAALKDNFGLMQLKDTKTEIENRLLKMSSVYQDTHPAMIKLRSELAEADKNIAVIIDDTLKVGRAALEESKKRLEAIDKEMPEAAQRLSSLKTSEPKLEDLKRHVEIDQKFYNEVLDRLKEGSFSFVEITNLGLIGQLDAVSTPIGPHKTRNILIGLLFGFLLGNVISFILKKRLKKNADIKETEKHAAA